MRIQHGKTSVRVVEKYHLGTIQCVNVAGNDWVRIYIGNGVGSDWFSEKVTLAKTVCGALWALKEEREEGSRFPKGCSEVTRPRERRCRKGRRKTQNQTQKVKLKI